MDWKERMDHQQEIIKQQVKDMKVKLKQAKKLKDFDRVRKIQSVISQLEHEVTLYNSRKVQPVRLRNGSVVNMKTINDFIKKLRHFPQYDLEHTNEDVQLHYKTRFGKGRLILVDMRERYYGWDLPVVDL